MLIELLRNEKALQRYISDECFENDISLIIDEKIDRDNILIIKIDRYYNHLINDPSKSPDCLIIQRCSDNNYIIYIVELRNIKNQNGFAVDEIVEKFTTCLEDFMCNRFANYFHNALFTYQNIHLLFISDPYGYKADPSKQEKLRGHKLDALIAQRIPKYFGKYLYIKHKIPNPTIINCAH